MTIQKKLNLSSFQITYRAIIKEAPLSKWLHVNFLHLFHTSPILSPHFSNNTNDVGSDIFSLQQFNNLETAMHQSSLLESTFKHLLFTPTLITHSECLKNNNSNIKKQQKYEPKKNGNMEVYSIKINSGSLAKLINNFGFSKKRKIWIALLFKYQNIQLTQLISVTNSSQKNGNLDSGFQRFLNPRPMQLISQRLKVFCYCNAIV